MNILLNINQYFLDFFNSFLNYSPIWALAPLFADLPIFFLPLFLLGMWVYYWVKKEREKQETLIYIFWACVIGLIISLIIQQFVHLDRPDQHIKNAAHLLLNKIPKASFPSDHATVSMAFLASLYFFNQKKTFWYFLPFVLLMDICRIIVWVHWPFDILVGMIIWILSAFLVKTYGTKIIFVKKINSFIIFVSSLLKL